MARYYVDVNNDGCISGFYVDEIHGDNIPETAIPITIEEWQTYAADPNKYKLDGGIIREKTPEEIDAEQAQRPPAPPTLEQRLEATEQALIAIMEAMSVV